MHCGIEDPENPNGQRCRTCGSRDIVATPNRSPAAQTRAARRRQERHERQLFEQSTSIRLVRANAVRVFGNDPAEWLEEWFELVGWFPDHETWAAWTPPADPTARFGWESANHVVMVWWPKEASREEQRESIYLGVKRLDKAPMADWRVKQRIKNAILGDEAEAVELYPAESRLIDESNHYHLFGVLPPARIPLGWRERKVGDGDGLSAPGQHRQRPLSDQGGPL
jgi:hypothetical protein